MRVHLLGLPNSQTHRSYALDGFAQMTIRCATMLQRLGHEVILYASEMNDAPCDELVCCITLEEQQTLLGTTPYQYAAIDEKTAIWQLANPRMTREIGKRKHPHDFILTIGGGSQAVIAQAHPELMCVEYSIGYIGSFADYRVFESHAWRHATHGFQNNDNMRWFDTVIPGFFDATEFEFCATPDPYYVYAGRLIERKGLRIACDAARIAGVPLKIIGHGDPSLITYGEYVGAVDTPTRNRIMAHAAAMFAPTYYVEPFNCAAVEAQLCGTPIISTDLGGFTETVEQGKTGFRCTYMGEFVDAVSRVRTLDRQYIRDRALATYTIEAVAPLYQRYFERLQLLRTPEGWNSLVVPGVPPDRVTTALAKATAFGATMAQHPQEIREAVSWLLDRGGVERVLEIGTSGGATAALWCELATDQVVSVDLPDGIHGGVSVVACEARNAKLREAYSHFTGVLGDSRAPETISTVRATLTGPVDLLFIDGDHRYTSVRGDYDAYRDLVRPGGVVMFHDIEDCAYHRDYPGGAVEVSRLWAEIDGEKAEFMARAGWGGLGAVVVS